MHQHATLEDTVYFGFAANLTSGAAGDGATPLYDVRLAGAASSAAPVLSGTPTLLSHANYSDGLHEVAIAATAANGFAANNTYLVFVTLTIDSVTPAACIGSFRLAPIPANMIHLVSDAQSATDLKDFADAGYDPSTNKVQGVVLVDTLTTYTGNTPQSGDNYGRLGAPAGASVSADIAAMQADIDTGLSMLANIAAVGGSVNTVAESYTLTTGTQTSGTYASTALIDSVPHTHTDTAGTMDLYYQFDIGVQGLPSSVGVTAYANGASDNIAIQAYNWTGTAFETVGTIIGKSGATYDSGTYTLLTRHVGTGANIGKVRIRFYATGLTSSTLYVDQVFVAYMVGQAYQYTPGTVNTAGATTTVFATTLTNADNFWNDALLIFTSGALAGQCKPIQDFANASGTVTLDEALTSAPANGDAFVIKADHIHPISQIQSGIATSAEVAAISTTIGVAGAGLTALATQASVNVIDDLLDTEIAAIKTKTDQLIFTKTNELDVNLQSVNGVTVNGDGAATPMGV